MVPVPGETLLTGPARNYDWKKGKKDSTVYSTRTLYELNKVKTVEIQWFKETQWKYSDSKKYSGNTVICEKYSDLRGNTVEILYSYS